MKGDDIHLYCCFVSKVRRQLGILQLRRGNGTSCYWQGTDVWGKVGIQRPFFCWQKSTRETRETRRDCHPNERRTLKYTGKLAHERVFSPSFFFFFLIPTPPKHLTASGCQRSVGQGWNAARTQLLGVRSKAELSWRKKGKKRKEKKADEKSKWEKTHT